MVKEITVKNKIKENVDFLIRTDELRPNFNLKTDHLTDVEITDVAVVFCLKPDETAILPFEFIPQSTGEYSVTLPIYLKEYNNHDMFNYIELTGIYPEVIIKCPAEIALEPIPLGRVTQHNLYFTMSNHTTNCYFYIHCSIPEVTIKYPRGRYISCNEITCHLYACIFFCSDKPLSYHTNLEISCGCGAYGEIKFMACADSCTITTHLYYFQYKSVYSSYSEAEGSSDDVREPKREDGYFRFPYFVLSQDKSEYALYMQKVCDSVENWLFKQVMFGQYFVSIPDQIRDSYLDLCTSCDSEFKGRRRMIKLTKETEEKPVIIIILIKMLGDQVKPMLHNG